MSHYKPYPKYKSSGVDWLDRVPEHWDVMRLRYIAHFANSNVDKKSYEGQQPVKLCNYTDVYNNENITATLPFMDATASDAEIETFALKTGDVLITKDSEDPSDIGIPAIVTDDVKGVICGYHLTMIRTHDPSMSAFVHRSLQSHPTKAYFFVESPGITRYGLSQDAIGDIKVCRPPEEECVLVASWISRETSRIDALISKKVRFIELLNEKRRALITRAVVKGLDPRVKMKASGVEWLGDIPTHWDVVQVKRLLDSMEYGLSETSEDGGAIEFLTMGNIQDGRVVRTGEKYLRSVPTEYLLRKSDLLFNRTNSLDLVGKVGLLREEPLTPVTFASYLVRLRCKSQVNPEYLNYYLGCDALLEIARALAIPSVSQANLNPNRYGYLQAPLPPKTEQDAIAAYLSAHDARIRKLQARTQKSIDLLRERRGVLITAAVTGQIDLRNVA